MNTSKQKQEKRGKSKHRRLKITLLCTAVILAAVIVAAWAMFGTQLQAAMTIEKQGEGLWSMEYKGDYGFDGYLEQGGAKSDSEMGDYIASFLSHGFWKPDTSTAGGEYGCSTITAKSPDGTALFGRNFDWEKCNKMIVHTIPNDGYESIATCNLDFLGFGEGWEPDKSMGDKFMSLASVYAVLDGMNEKGLCVADLMVSNEPGVDQNTEKPDITITSGIRLLLDKAANVDEATELLSQYDMHFSLGRAQHFSISDATGKSVAVEWKNGEMAVTETNVVTNFYINGDDGSSGSDQSYVRFDTLTKLWQDSDGVMTTENVRDALASVAQSNFPGENGGELTCWSLVYDRQNLTAVFYDSEDWSRPYTLSLGQKDWFLPPKNAKE